MDKYFRVEVVAKTPRPQFLVYSAAKNDYAENFLGNEFNPDMSEEAAGKELERMLWKSKTRPHCFDDKTEILTDQGFRLFSEVINTDVKVAAIDPNTQKIKFEKPSRWVAYEVDEMLYKVTGQSLDIAVTLDHNMLVSHRHKNNTWTDWYSIKAADLGDKPVRYLKAGVMDDSQCRPIPNTFGLSEENFAALIGFAVGDGYSARPNQIVFHLKKQRKIDFLQLILGDLYGERYGNEYTVTYPGIGSYFQQNCYTEDRQKKLPDGFMYWSNSAKQALLLGLKNSDGRKRNKNWEYNTTSLLLANQFSALCAVMGLATNLLVSNYLDNPKHKICYGLRVSDRITPRVETRQKNRAITYEVNYVEYQGMVYCCTVSTGAIIVRRNGKYIVAGNCGCYEHPHITFAVGGYVHSVMVQLRTHRILSMDVQSSRFSGKRVCKVASGELPFEEVFYIRPVGVYQNRHGDRCELTEEWREKKKQAMMVSIIQYAEDVANGEPKESARDIIPQGLRQNFYVTLNARSLMHIINVRSAKDCQLEIRDLIDKMMEHFAVWMPETAKLVLDKFYVKGHLTP